jgi:Rhs element Vgr protein
MANLSATNIPGIVTSADFGGTIGNDSIHVLTIEPALVRARSFHGFAMFERQTAKNIVDRVLINFGIQPTFLLTGTQLQTEHESQWDETSLDFVRRLLEREGFHFHFAEDGQMIVGDSNTVFGIGPSLAYLGHFADPGTLETVSSFRVGASASPAHVAVRGWDVRRKVTVTGEAMAPGLGEIITYRADADGLVFASARANALLGSERAEAVIRTGTSNSPGLRAGKLVSIAGAGSAFNGSYVVTGVRHVLSGTESCFAYGNSFTAIPSSVPFRPEAKTKVPRFAGTVSALVTNNNDPDRLGRVKVRFPWLPTEESGWARIAVSFVGAGFVLPEVDDEVLVAFENGDLEHPYVLGTLWNGVDRPPTSP